MNVARVLSVAVPLVVCCACSGGGGGSTSGLAAPAWEKFRHDVSNTGQGFSDVGSGTRTVKWSVQIDAPPTPSTTPGVSDEAATGKPVSSSPAIATDGTIYVGSEGGTLAAVNPSGTIKWRATTCDCPAPVSSAGAVSGTAVNLPLGSLVGSPAVYTLNGQTSVLIGSMTGTLFIFEDNGSAPSCTTCFAPHLAEFGQGTIAQFASSPTFTINSATSTIAGVFIGATIADNQGHRWGKLYAVNNDGSESWEFPRASGERIGPVTSSPALGFGNTLYFTAADTELEDMPAADNLYAVTSNGTLRWKSPIGRVLNPAEPSALASSPLVDVQIYVATADGSVFSINPNNGNPRWRVRPMLSPDDGIVFISSLAIGNPVSPTPGLTPTPVATFTPASGGSATPLQMSTPTPQFSVTVTPTPPTLTVFGVTKSGTLVVIDAATGVTLAPSGPLQTPIPSPVISSPALSGDALLIFGANDGKLHIVNTTTGTDSPVTLKKDGQLDVAVMIRSSPAIAGDGTIYVGADDGLLYAIGTQ